MSPGGLFAMRMLVSIHRLIVFLTVPRKGMELKDGPQKEGQGGRRKRSYLLVSCWWHRTHIARYGIPSDTFFDLLFLTQNLFIDREVLYLVTVVSLEEE